MIKECLKKSSRLAPPAAITLAALTSFIATDAPAQPLGTVRLETFDGQNSISGELISVEADTYRIMTIAGVIGVAIETVDCIGAACPELNPRFVIGETVTLTFKDGSTSVTGEVMSFNAAAVTIKSALFGEVILNRAEVLCSGPNCHLSTEPEPAQSASSILDSLLNGTQD